MTDKRTNNDLQNTIQRTKDRATRISLKSDAGGNKDCHKLITYSNVEHMYKEYYGTIPISLERIFYI